MGSAVVVVKSPTVDDPASLCQAEEQLAIQELITQLAVEALHVAVLPGAAWGNEQRLDVGLAEPFAYLLRHELWTAGTDAQRWSAADELGSPSHGKQVTQDFHNLPGGERSSNLDRQALASEFVDHYQEPNLSSIFGSIGDEVVRPDVIFVLGTSTDAAILAATIGQPSATVLFSWDLPAFFPPDSLDSLVIDVPTGSLQRAMHAGTAVPWTTMGDASHLGQELPLVPWSLRLVTLRRAWLTQHTTSSTLGDCFRPQPATHLSNSEATSLGAQKFPCAASFKMALSRA